MGLEKIGTTIGKEIIAWTRTGGKSRNPNLQTRIVMKYTYFCRRQERWHI